MKEFSSINNKNRHAPGVILTWDDCEDIQEWLPEGGDLSERLYAVMKKSFDKANDANAEMDLENARLGAKAPRSKANPRPKQ